MLADNLVKKLEENNIQGSETKPLYISKISIDGDNSASPLSNSLYKAILEPALSQPLQTVSSSLSTFEEIRKKLLYTGLFQDVSISLGNDVDGKSVDYLREKVPREYGIELPISTHAKILLKPSAFYSNTAGTTTLNDDISSIGICRSWMNLLGHADTEMFHLGLSYNPLSSKWDGKFIKGNFSLPLAKNPSIRAKIDLEASQVGLKSKPFISSTDMHDEYLYAVSVGFQKRWMSDKSSSVPTFYNGISVTNRAIDGLGLSVPDLYNKYSRDFKTSFNTRFFNDTRKYFGTFPVSGYQIDFNNEYVISEADATSKILPQGNNFDKVNFSLQHHVSYFKNKLTRSFDLQFGGILPFSDINDIHPMDKFYLGGLNSLKGFESRSVGIGGSNFFYKLGINSSHKLINTPMDSPLRLQFFANLGNSFDTITSGLNSFAAASGVSLLYKTPEANMDLTYAYPLTSRPEDVVKPGLSFGITFAYF